MSAALAQPHKAINPWWVAAAVIVPTFMEVLDTTIMAVSLPNIAGNLSASTSEATWVQTSYLISNAVVLPACAWFSSFFGRKRFLLACIMLFTVASVVCGMAPTLAVLLLARVVQGAGGGALQPISQAVLLESFPPAKHGVAMAAYGLGVIIAPVIGPVLGGWVTDHYSWRWLFYMNLPIGALAWWMVRRFVFDPDYIRDARPGRIDASGFFFLIVWLGTLQVILDKGQDADWFNAGWIRWFALISSLSCVAFIFRELTCAAPLADLRVFKNRNFAVGTVLISIAAVLMYGPLTLLPLFLQSLMGYSSFQCGIAQIPRGLGLLAFMPLVGIMINGFDNRKMIAGGFFVLGISTLGLSWFNLDLTQHDLFLPNFMQGAGLAFCMVPLMTVSLGMLKKEQMGNATGIFALARNLFGSIGIALVTSMVTRGAQIHQAAMVEHVTPYNPLYQSAVQTAQGLLGPQVGAVKAQAMADGLIYQTMLQQSAMMAYLDDFRLLAFLSILAVPMAFLLKRVTAKGTVAVH
ncbi:MAG: DHA2 family efflux MFS transporter permease subunit [Chthoniobacteraceae bacterium]